MKPGQTNFQSADYRKALGTFATGVTVVTAAGAKGELAGLTANSFTSVSLEPPLILWCLANSSDNLATFQSAACFAVNILAADQKAISDHFARRQKDKFSGINWRQGIGGIPLIEDCVCWLQCRLVNQYEAGDHHIFIGQVEQLETSGREALLYHHGNYSMSLPLPEDQGAHDESAEAGPVAPDSLYTLLLRAIHTYQERFETRQQRLIDNPYEARLLIILNESTDHDVTELGRRIQIPKSEAEAIIADMEGRGLLRFDARTGLVELTATGAGIATRLWQLARQHEADARTLLGSRQVPAFLKNLVRLGEWRRDPAADD